MKTLLITLLTVSTLGLAKTPQGVSSGDWSSIRAAYEAGRHQFYQQADGSHTARNPGLGWTMEFDESGFTATNGQWTWGLELEKTDRSDRPNTTYTTSSNNHLYHQRTPHLTEWFINDQRGLEQGWTLTAPAEIRLRVRGSLPSTVSPQSISFGNQLTYSGLKAWDATGRIIPTHFEATQEGFAVRYDDTGATYPITIDPLAQNAYLKASNTGASDQFGESVAISGDTVVVGADGEDSNATGVNGNGADNSANGAGAAYVFVRSGSSWSQQAYLKASNTGANDLFGNSVAVSGDTVVVGARQESSSATGVNGNGADNSAADAGAAYVFVRRGNTWSQQAYLKASNTGANDRFGTSVAVSGDTVVVGASEEASNANEVNGNGSDNSADDSGAAYVFVRSGSSWSQQAYLKASNTGAGDLFGASIAVDGTTVVVGAPGESSNAIGINGNEADNSESTSGAAYVFTRSGSSWSQQAYLKASNTGLGDSFGTSVALSGDTVVVGAPGESSNATGINGNEADNSASIAGAAYVFTRSGSSWSQQAYLKASNAGALDFFGGSVAVSGDTVVVGAFIESSNATGVNGNQSDNSVIYAGAAYLFSRSASSWSQQAYLKASNTAASDQFGYFVALSGDTVVVGAYGEASNATGVNGNQTDNSVSIAGAAYIFNIGEILTSVTKSGTSAPGGTDLTFAAPGVGAVGPGGVALLETALVGAGTAAGKNRALYSTLGGSTDLVLQKGVLLSGVLGLPANAKVASLTAPQHNRTASTSLFQITVTGKGINASSNRMLLKDDGTFYTPLLRTGSPITALGSASLSSIREVLQGSASTDRIVVSYNLKKGGTVNAGNDTGMLILDHTGSITSATAREGNITYPTSAFSLPETFGPVGRVSLTSNGDIGIISKLLSDLAPPKDALFTSGSVSERNVPLQGDLAGGTTANEKYGTFTGVTQLSTLPLLRATMTSSPVTTNEGVWNSGGTLLLRKGQDLGGSLAISRILRVWGLSSGQVIAHIQLKGSGVNTRNNQALILRQAPNDFLILMRTGQPAPGIGLNKVVLAKFQAIDVDPINGHYVILGSLRGAAATANQALWSGHTALAGDLRLPRLQLLKGDIYHTSLTPSGRIRGIALKPVVDPSGVGGRGLAQVINDSGQILLTLTGDRSVRETVRLTP